MNNQKLYIQSHVQNHRVSDFEALKFIAKRIGKKTNKTYVRRDKHMHNMLKERKEMNMYITCRDAIELSELMNISLKEYPYFHSLCPYILDWWNISTDNFSDGALCYYAHFGEYHPTTGSRKLTLPLDMPCDFKEITYQ
jgi:hypothetical protein